MGDLFIWIGIAICITQSAMFSGLNLAFFSLTRLNLEIEAQASPKGGAKNVLKMRQDSNFLLTTILWGNVGINVLLTLLSGSVMAGVISFSFSTGLITIFGEIVPQAYFSRNALKMASLLAPALKFYQVILYPLAKPSALLLDAWLGEDSIHYISENNIKLYLKKHTEDKNTEINHLEGIGAINFLSIDDLKAFQEGVEINPNSIISLETEEGKLVYPAFEKHPEDPFIQRINSSGEKWVIFTNEENEPLLTLDTDRFIRSVLFSEKFQGIEKFCHVPLIIRDKDTDLGEIIKGMRGDSDVNSDKPIDKDMVLLWDTDIKRIITGADIFGRLLKGI